MEGREWRCPNGCPTKGEVESHKKAVVHFEAECASLRASSVTLQGALDEALGEVGRLKEKADAAMRLLDERNRELDDFECAVDDNLPYYEVGEDEANSIERIEEAGVELDRVTNERDSLRASLESADKMLGEVAGAGKVDVPAVDWIDYQIDRDLAARIDAYLAGRKS